MFEVVNQPPPLEPYNLFASDIVLREAVRREQAEWAEGGLNALGVTLGKPETVQLGFDANKNPPVLRTLDRYGHRLDEVEFHPAWHELLGLALRAGLHSSPWAHPQAGAHVARAAGTYMLNQIESGVYCPVAMTYGSVPTLRQTPEVAAHWLPKIYGRDYDKRFVPLKDKTAALVGMGMTENQGGSDLRTNTTRAEPAGDGSYRLHGHKWFMSAPMCDAFLVLAQSARGLSCFLLPRWTPDGERNGIHIVRLKDKLGNKSNASPEVEFHGAWAERVGTEGAGVRTIIEMVNLTRLDCAIASAGQSRIALSQALHHIRNRSVFQRRLADQPAMRAVAADMALELEAQAALVFRLVRAAEHAAHDPREAAYARLLTPAVKFLVCKSTPQLVYESLECLGGNGYTEDLPLARYFRESPLNAVWEGSGNVMALDVLRAAGRHPEAATDTLSRLVRTADQAFKAGPLAQTLEQTLKSGAAERRARFLCESLAKIAAVAALVEAGSPFAALYAETRLGGSPFAQFGSADLGDSETALIDRALAA